MTSSIPFLISRMALTSSTKPLSQLLLTIRRLVFGAIGIFEVFETMVGELRRRQEAEIARVDRILEKLSDAPVEMVFIRAPIIEKVGSGVTVLAEDAGHPVLVREGKILASTFHPELSDDATIHKYFIDIATGKAK